MAVTKSLFERKLKNLKIQNRRYLGSKYKLKKFIEKIVDEYCPEWDSFADLFAGTGIIGHTLNSGKKKIISNDYLYSNFVSLSCWLSKNPYNEKKVEHYLNKFNRLKGESDNYFYKNFGGKYFSEKNAKKIGEIRDLIEKKNENNELNEKEKNILLTSLMYAADRIANTCGHYDAYRGQPEKQKKIELRKPKIDKTENKNNEIFQEDANELAKKTEVDIAYIDPPYNSRQYCDTYHLLENLARWNKPPVFGKAAKMDRSNLKSDYCRKEAPEVFDDLIKSISAKWILVSYNNIGKKGDSRSNAKISDREIMTVLENKGKVKVFDAEHQNFSAGQDDIKDHKERVFLCKI